RGYLRHGNVERLDSLERKSLSSFSFSGAAGSFLLPPTMSDRVLSCLVSPTDLSGLVDSITISTGSVQYLIDSAMLQAQWSCGGDCFTNTGNQDFNLGTLEIKAEPLRLVLCSTKEFLEDAAINIESWLMEKAATAFRTAINNDARIGGGLTCPNA